MRSGAAPWRYYVLADYLLLTFILELPLVFSGNFAGAAGLLAAPLAAWLPLPSGRLKTRSRPWLYLALSPENFIWHTVIRQVWPLFVLVLVLTLLIWAHFGFFIGAMVAFIFGLTSMFEQVEPFQMLPGNRRAFIRRWRKMAAILYVVLLPASVFLLIKEPSWWGLIPYFAICLESLLLLGLSYKMVYWYPGRRRMHGAAALNVAVLSALLPGGMVITVSMALFYFYQYWKNAK